MYVECRTCRRLGVDAMFWHQGVPSEHNKSTASTTADVKIVLLQCSNTDILTEPERQGNSLNGRIK
jgi:hypothetical protein